MANDTACMTIQDAIQKRWDILMHDCPLIMKSIASIFTDGDDLGDSKGMFRKSLGLVWGHFQELMSKDNSKSTLLLIAPPYRRTEILECVLRILVAREMSSAKYLSADEIRDAWKNQTQVMMCFKSWSKKNERWNLRRIAYTPRVDDVLDGQKLCYRACRFPAQHLGICSVT